MVEPNRVLVRMLDRLFGAMLNGPSLNCRPHASRQRADLCALGKLRDGTGAEVMRALLSDERAVKVVAKARPPKEEDEQSEQAKAFAEQESLLTKLRVIAEDARTYEQDTGVHVLNIGFPLLSLPPAAFGQGSGAGSSRRILAPVAFIPVSLTIKRGASTAVEMACRLEGMDLVQPNAALLAWLEQQTGTPATAELFEDHEGADPWREVRELAGRVCKILDLPLPDIFKEPPPAPPPVEGQPLPAAPDPLAEVDVQAIPRADEMEQPQLLPCAVLGLFPASNQGLLRDMKEMITDEKLAGPVQSFIRAGISLDQPPEQSEPEAAPAERKIRRFEDERFIAAADPFQSRAVKTARQVQGLVIHGPPGTGKSQTITNIIADHLARGQRVLMVCDKRTALDVVANRLEHMGLGPLVALVHDAQRDQRDLYRSLRDQLDVLAEAQTDAKAAQKLQKVDKELQELHDELTTHWQALMLPTVAGVSFHEMVGQWLALGGDSIVFEEPSLAHVPLAELDAREVAIRELFDRGKAVSYTANLWTIAAGIALADFLARAMSEIRAKMGACVSVAQAADATRDPAIPPFAPSFDLTRQAQGRLDLATRLESLLGAVDPAILAKWAKQDALSIDRARQRLAEVDALLRAFRAAPLDAELDAFVRPVAPRLTEVVTQLGTLDAYLQIAETWHAFLHFKSKREAGETLGKYGLPLSAEAAKRLKAFLTGVRARLSLMNVHRELADGMAGGVPAAEAAPAATNQGLLGDAALDASLTQHSQALDLLHHVRTDGAVLPVIDRVVKVYVDPSTAAALLDGLRKSEARAAALKQLEDALAATRLIDARWLADFSSRIRAGDEALPKVDPLNDRLDTLESVLRIREALPSLPSSLRTAAEQSLRQGLAADDALRAMRRTMLAGHITSALRANPNLQAIDAQRIESAFARYRKLDGQKQELVRDVILHQWVTKQQERLLAATGSRLNSAGADLRRRLTLRGQRAMRLRQVVAAGQSIEGGDPLFDMTPVWMASPETVAQIFSREPLFDVVVFDEASQCRLEEALPVLVRAKRVVIAGDPKQLPPTRFFESAVATSDEDEVENEQQLFEQHQGEIEDLLAAALGLEIEQSYLDVHYRSRYPELIGFSNLHFYASRLQPIPAHPSRRPAMPPIRLCRADGVYEKRSNPKEADQVCQIVRELLSQRKPPSIGIACFNVTQRDLIIDRLDDLAAEDADFSERLTTARERVGDGSFQGLFVKNLENVQGDERDHMIISTTYGPDANGRFYRRFGPLLQSGGGRRLNVLVTRARHQVHIVTSIPPEAYRSLPQVPQGQNPNGAYLLFAYLKYAEEVQAAFARGDQVITSDAEPRAEVNVRETRTPSVFAKALAEQLARQHNVPSEVYWGNDGFMVDVALRDPQDSHAVRLGLLCDGSRFTQAEDPVEWDIFRTAIHEAQGWKLMRLWTPHFFRDPEGTLSAIARAV